MKRCGQLDAINQEYGYRALTKDEYKVRVHHHLFEPSAVSHIKGRARAQQQ
jgi:hypothetical protein